MVFALQTSPLPMQQQQSAMYKGQRVGSYPVSFEGHPGYLSHEEMMEYRQVSPPPPCPCPVAQTEPKILQSILSYHFNSRALDVHHRASPVHPPVQHSLPKTSRDSQMPGARNATGWYPNSPYYFTAMNNDLSETLCEPSRTQPSSPHSHCSSPGGSYCQSPNPSYCPSPASCPSPAQVVPSPGGAQQSKLFNILSRSHSQSPPAPSHTATSGALSSNKRSHEAAGTDEPMDLSCKRPKPQGSDLHKHATRELHWSQTGSSERVGGKAVNSILQSILAGAKRHGATNCTRAIPSATLTHDAQETSQCSNKMLTAGEQKDMKPPNPATQKVTLAKKNLFPVSARVSDWLFKIVQFANSLPEFVSLTHSEKVVLILNSWARIMLLYMAETNFEFAVTPVREGQSSSSSEGSPEKDGVPPAEVPTMRSVEVMQAFIRKCQSLNLDAHEYNYMRMVTLFNPGQFGIESPEFVENVATSVRRALQDHIQTTKPHEKMRYSHILMCLPTLFGINTKMVDNLFCRHISGNTDVEVLLKELIRKR